MLTPTTLYAGQPLSSFTENEVYYADVPVGLLAPGVAPTWTFFLESAGASNAKVRFFLPAGGCNDGNDDDGDGLTDLADPGCADANDSSEKDAGLVCDDGIGNDNDGLVDIDDSDCLGPLIGVEGVAQTDTDSDGIWDVQDNCVLLPNSTQLNTDGDLYGNACDGDFNQDGFVSIADFNLFLPAFRTTVDVGNGTDMDGSGAVGIADFSLFLPGFQMGKPGPSGLVP